MNGAAGGLENIWLKNILYELKYFKLYTECVFTDMYMYEYIWTQGEEKDFRHMAALTSSWSGVIFKLNPKTVCSVGFLDLES